MKIYDISQELLSCEVFPGDPSPCAERIFSIKKGSLYNLTALSLCAHNGTHVDAPFHFIDEGKTVDDIPLEKTVGKCYVTEFEGRMGREDAERIIKRAAQPENGREKRLLFKGNTIITAEAAEVFSANGTYLIGVELQSVGDPECPMETHIILLSSETVLLEGIRLAQVGGGEYFLFAAPISVRGSDGAPCRACLVSEI